MINVLCKSYSVAVLGFEGRNVGRRLDRPEPEAGVLCTSADLFFIELYDFLLTGSILRRQILDLLACLQDVGSIPGNMVLICSD